MVRVVSTALPLIKDNGNFVLTLYLAMKLLFYDKFAVGPASNEYKLSISGFSGITFTTDPFHDWHTIDGMKFTTKDRDIMIYHIR